MVDTFKNSDISKLSLYFLGAKRSVHDWQVNNRSNHRLEEMASIFEYRGRSFSSGNNWTVTSSRSNMQEIINRQSVKACFDLICRDGWVTTEIGEYFHLKKENILGGDDYDAHNERITFVPVDLNQSTIKLGMYSFSPFIVYHRRTFD